MNKMLVAKVMATLNNNHPVMENVDGLMPITDQIVRVMPSNLGYVYEKMNLTIDNALIEGRLKAHDYEDGNGLITVNMVKDLAYDDISSAYDAMLSRIGGKYDFETAFTHDCLYRYAITVEKNGLSATALMNLVNEEKQFGMLYNILESLSHQLVALNTYKSKITEEEEYLTEAVYSSIKEEYAEGVKKLRISKEENKMAKINEAMENIEKRYLENENCFQEFCETITGADLADLTLTEIVELYGALSNKIDGDVVIRENIQDDVCVEVGKTVLGSQFSAENSLKERVNRFEQWLSYEHECDCDLCVDSQTSGEDVDVNYARREQTARIDKAFNAIVKQGEEPFTTSVDEDCPF